MKSRIPNRKFRVSGRVAVVCGWKSLTKPNAASAMKILALEFSSNLRSVAVIDDGRASGRAQEPGARASRALGLVESALREAELEREQVDCLAVGLGPGSYTGTRSAIALAQGWQLALGTRILGISSVECLAAAAHFETIRGLVNVVIDAQRREFYLAGYEIGA